MPTRTTSALAQVTPDCLAAHFAMEPKLVLSGKPSGDRAFATFSFPNQRARAPIPHELPPDSPTAASPRLLFVHSTPVPTIQHILERVNRSLGTRAKFERRLEVLTDEAEADGSAFNPDSEVAFRWFLDEHPFLRSGRLFLMDNGNLRATWKDDRDTHVGLQFLPGDSVQYVIFTRRPSSRTISRVHGYDTLDGIPRLLAAYDLSHILAT